MRKEIIFLLPGKRLRKILSSDTRLILAEDVLYLQVSDGSWLIHDFSDVGKALSFFTELSPAALFPAERVKAGGAFFRLFDH